MFQALQFLQTISAPLTWAFVSIIVLSLACFLYYDFKKRNLASKYLNKNISLLSESKSNISSLNIDGLWKNNWGQFISSLLTINDNSGENKTWASKDPNEFFSLAGLQAKAGLDQAAIANRPSVLTGLGITFTFFGLVVGVSAAGENLSVINSSNADILGMIEPLLQGAGVSFSTSLAGLISSLLYSWRSHAGSRKLEAQVNQWNEELRSIFPLINQSVIAAQNVNNQNKILSNIEAQGHQLQQLVNSSSTSIEHQNHHGHLLEKMTQTIADDLTKAMIAALDQIRSDRREADHSMVEEFSNCLSKMSQDFNDSIRVMVSDFHGVVRDMAGEEMERFTAQLSNLHGEYVIANEQLVQSNSEMLTKIATHSDETLQRTNAIGKQLANGMTQTEQFTTSLYQRFDRLQQEMRQWVYDTLEDSRSVIHSDLVAVGHSLKENAESAGQLLKNNADIAGKGLISAGKSFNDDLQQSAETIAELSLSLQEQSVSELKNIFDQAGYSLENKASIAGGELINGSQEIGRIFTKYAQLLGSDATTACEQLSTGMTAFAEGAKQAGDEIAAGIRQGVSDITEEQKHWVEKHEELAEDIYNHWSLAGKTLQEQASLAGNELKASSEEAARLFTESATCVSNEAYSAGQKLSSGMNDFAESAKLIGQTVAEEITASVSTIANDQQQWTERHEEAAQNLYSSMEEVSEKIHEAAQHIFSGWAEKVAEASASLVVASERSGKMADSIKPVMETQEKLTQTLAVQAQMLANAAESNQPMQELIANGLQEATKSYNLLAEQIEGATELNGHLEEQLNNLSEELAAQHDRFAENLSQQMQSQQNAWNKQQKSMSSLSDSHSKRVHTLDNEITKAMDNVTGGLTQYAKKTSDFIEGIDRNASDILSTLASAIQEMKALDDKKAADELRALASSVNDMKKALVATSSDGIKEAAA